MKNKEATSPLTPLPQRRRGEPARRPGQARHRRRGGPLLCFLLFAFCFSGWAGTVDATYTFTDFQLTAQAVRRVTQTPLEPFADYNGAILSAAPRSIVTGTNGSVTFSNTVAGYSYRVTLDTPYGSTVRTSGYPANLSGPVNGRDWLGEQKGMRFYYLYNTNGAGLAVAAGTNLTMVRVAGTNTLNLADPLVLGDWRISHGTAGGDLTFFNLTDLGQVRIRSDGEFILDNSQGGRFIGDGSGLTNLSSAGALTNNEARDVRLNSSLKIVQPGPGFSISVTNNQGSNTFVLDDGGNATFLDTVTAVQFNGTVPASDISGKIPNDRLSGMTNMAMMTPYDFGAAGDGVTDDTAAIWRWVDTCSKSNWIAYLPPAFGDYYKITDAINITNFTGLRILGAGGQVVGTSPVVTRCRIHQMTSGKDGFVIGRTNNGAVTPDHIVIEGIAITAETYNWTSRGIAFAGTAADSDCDTVRDCTVRNFGKGIYLRSASSMEIVNCSVGYGCGEGIRIGDSSAVGGGSQVINGVYLRMIHMGQCKTNEIHCDGGSAILIDSCDAGTGEATDHSGDNEHGLLIENGADVTVINCIDWQGTSLATNSFIVADGGAIPGGVTLKLINVAAGGTSCPYALVATNARVYVERFVGTAANTPAVLWNGQPQDLTAIGSAIQVTIVFGRTETETIVPGIPTYYTGSAINSLPGGSIASLRTSDASEISDRLDFRARFTYGGSGAHGATETVNLLDFHQMEADGAITNIHGDNVNINYSTGTKATTNAGQVTLTATNSWVIAGPSITVTTNLQSNGERDFTVSATNQPYAVFWQQKNAGTDGDHFTSATWTNTMLNTVNRDTLSAFSLSGGVLTVNAAGAGRWKVRAVVPIVDWDTGSTHYNKARLRRTNNTAATLLVGQVGLHVEETDAVHIVGSVALSSGDTLELQGWASSPTPQFGKSPGSDTSGEVNIFALIEFERE